MTTSVEIATAQSALGAFDFAALIPLGAVLSLIGVLIAAAWAARSAMIVRMLDSQRAAADRYAAFQQDAVAAINELGLSMARYVERATDAVTKAAQQATPGATGFSVRLDPEWEARVTRATDAWRLILARGHAFAGNGVHDALRAVDEQRAIAVEQMNAHRFSDAGIAIDQLRRYEGRQAYRRLQIVALEREIVMMRLVRTRWLARAVKRDEATALAELRRGEQMIADAERDHDVRNAGGADSGGSK